MPDPASGEPEPAATEPEDHSHDLPPASPAQELTPADLTPPDATPAPDYDEHGTPSLDYVRDKIEGRYATSLGAGELAEDTDRVRDQEEQVAERDRKAADRLAEIRRSLG
ncbi:hypothetical protein EV383_1709 [Pseudonocardia sediminis]|uniref:PspA domain-containing protein n=1 Tax=Pseudonocardia sediminis TaxID=1397368 RepID=A0A4Q7UXD7_PSEST|nr:hypothetical protein [Pseudonocardia sediminis]RZT84853.1 hypothetical protein EV383_1709 [Pseudonocardia sediminis]